MRTNQLITAVCVICGLCGTAHAQVAVDSVTADFNALKDLLGQAKALALQGQQYVTEAQQLTQLVNTFNAFVENPSLGVAMGLMTQTGLGNDLPINPASLMSRLAATQ